MACESRSTSCNFFMLCHFPFQSISGRFLFARNCLFAFLSFRGFGVHVLSVTLSSVCLSPANTIAIVICNKFVVVVIHYVVSYLVIFIVAFNGIAFVNDNFFWLFRCFYCCANFSPSLWIAQPVITVNFFCFSFFSNICRVFIAIDSKEIIPSYRIGLEVQSTHRGEFLNSIDTPEII